MAVETNASSDDNGGKEVQENERRYNKSHAHTSCIGIRCRFADASAVYRTMENSRSNNRIVDGGGDPPEAPLRKSVIRK